MNAYQFLKSVAGYHDIVLKANTQFNTNDFPVLIPHQLEYSDYNGSMVERANHQAFLERFEDDKLVLTHSGLYNYECIMLHPNALRVKEIKETLDALSDYPLIDDDKHSELCFEEYHEQWTNYGCSDFERYLNKKFDLEDSYPKCYELLEDISNEDKQIFYEKMLTAGEYYIEETGGLTLNISYAIDKVNVNNFSKFLMSHRH